MENINTKKYGAQFYDPIECNILMLRKEYLINRFIL